MEDSGIYTGPRTGTTAIRYRYSSGRAANAGAETRVQTPAQTRFIVRSSTPHTDQIRALAIRPQPTRNRKALFIGGIFGLMLIGHLAISTIWSLGGNIYDDLRYGRPRTFSTDAQVGHSQNPSRFIIQNINGQIYMTEINEDQTSIQPVGPAFFGPGADLFVATAEFRDVNGDQLPDLLLKVRGGTYIYINDGEHFRLAKPDEKVRM